MEKIKKFFTALFYRRDRKERGDFYGFSHKETQKGLLATNTLRHE